jgi:tetratricopeptide (TPR) repeat protein
MQLLIAMMAIALTACGAFVSNPPPIPTASALELEAEGRPAEAIAVYDADITKEPMCPYHYFGRGNLYARLGEYESAFTDYRTAARLDPSGWAPWGQEAPQVRLGQYEFGDDQQASTSAHAKDYFTKGTVHAVEGRWVLAIEDLTKAISADPRYVAAYLNRGVAFEAADEADRAIQDHDKVVQHDPNYAKAYLNRGNAYRRLGQMQAIKTYVDGCNAGSGSAGTQRAIEDFTDAIRLDPQFGLAYQARSSSYSDLRLFMEPATEEFERLSELGNQDQKRAGQLGSRRAQFGARGCPF